LREAGLKRALKVMTDLKEIMVVSNIMVRGLNYYHSLPMQIKFYPEHRTGRRN
jgi:hypothetical protein